MDSHIVQKRLKIAIFLTFLIFCFEAAGGWIAGSLALLSDAGHMFSDVFALCLSWAALRISTLPSTSTKTYGYHRLEIFAALINGLLLLGMAGTILFEAFERFQNPQEVQTGLVLLVGGIGLITNLAVIYFLREPGLHSGDLNVKSALYHVLGDTLASVGVIIGAGVMWATGWYWVDALVGAAIALLLIWGAKNILSDSVHILLEGVPKGISVSEVKRELTSIPAVQNIHELHIWCICSNIYALSTHALVGDAKANPSEGLLREMQDLLRTKFNITHTTIQFESIPCRQGEVLCDMNH